MEQKNIRNFCIIAHIDHGKSTLADRFLEVTGTVSSREMHDRVMDTMELEQERGITIKLTPAQMEYKGHILNLIDTPGHVDFSYEVSRSLAAVEGAILLVDATQGIQAQTIANLYLALEQNLTVIPAINKIDLPNAEVEKVKAELVGLIGCAPSDIILTSGKTGAGVPALLDAVVERVPAPSGDASAPLRALIFDSFFDEYKGVVAYIRIVDGAMKKTQPIFMQGTSTNGQAIEIGVLKPKLLPQQELTTGTIGYVSTGLKEVMQCRVGDTITLEGAQVQALAGYKEVRPMVFAGIFCKEGDQFNELREAISKLKLNDAALTFESEHSSALGFGYRCGFLGMLHLEIFQERLRREYGLDLIVTAPSVAYKVTFKSEGLQKELAAKLKTKDVLSNVPLEANQLIIKSPMDLPDPNYIESIDEPIITADIVTPKQFLGPLMQLAQEKRGEYLNTEFLISGSADEQQRAVLHYRMPLATILTDFYDKLKSVSSGYGSLSYEFYGYAKADVVRLDIYVAEDRVEALSQIVYRDDAFKEGRRIVESLKETLPKQMFVVKLQAAVGGKVIAAERLSAMRKDVTGYLYGGDVTRKKKLLEKQKRGKKKMMEIGAGSVDIPTETFLKVLKR